MNVYAVVEGEIGEKAVYASWIPLAYPNLVPVSYLDEVLDNNVYIVSGGGYPNYFEVIEDAMVDVQNNPNIDRLVIAIDSEDATRQEKFDQINDFIVGKGFTKDYRIIVQHFCLETWALGNQLIVTRHPQNGTLRRYIQLHDVSTNDPELLQELQEEELNRSQFAEKYLRLLHNEKYRNLTYSKSNPRALLHEKYFAQIVKRRKNTGHIAAFDDFLSAFA